MDAKMAIKILHNNQYQKHLGNGEYDYIHPLTDAEVKGIEDLIQRQSQEITRLEGQHVFDNSQIVEYEKIVRVQAAKIERQEKMINTAIDVIQEDSGDCPLNAGCCCVEDEQCNGPCPLDGSDEQAIKCWRKWLEEAGE